MLVRILVLFMLLSPWFVHATVGDVIHYQEVANWIIFTKNDTELFAAKQVGYNEDPIFYAHDSKGKIYFRVQAQELWEDLEEQYRKHERKKHQQKNNDSDNGGSEVPE